MIQELYLNKAVIFLKCLSSRDLTGMISHPDLRGIEVFLGLRTFRTKTENPGQACFCHCDTKQECLN